MIATRSIVLIILAIVGVGLSSPAVPPDLSEAEHTLIMKVLDDGVRQSSAEQEKAMVLLLRRQTSIYQQKVKAIGPFAFEDRQSMSPLEATLLLEQAKSLASNLNTLLEALDLIPDNPDHTSAAAWLLVAASLSVDRDNMVDLRSAGLVDSKWPTLVRLILPRIFTKILHPKIMVLMEKSNCGGTNKTLLDPQPNNPLKATVGGTLTVDSRSSSPTAPEPERWADRDAEYLGWLSKPLTRLEWVGKQLEGAAALRLWRPLAS